MCMQWIPGLLSPSPLRRPGEEAYQYTHTDPCTHTPVVIIGFSDDNLSVIEGYPAQTVCLEVKGEGWLLDPFDFVPINIEIDSDIPGAVS